MMMRKRREITEPGLWVRLVLDTGMSLTGFAPGADSPNDFWSVFKTQLIRLEDAWETGPGGKRRAYPTLYVNRDRIVIVDVADADLELDGDDDPPSDA